VGVVGREGEWGDDAAGLLVTESLNILPVKKM